MTSPLKTRKLPVSDFTHMMHETHQVTINENTLIADVLIMIGKVWGQNIITCGNGKDGGLYSARRQVAVHEIATTKVWNLTQMTISSLSCKSNTLANARKHGYKPPVSANGHPYNCVCNICKRLRGENLKHESNCKCTDCTIEEMSARSTRTWDHGADISISEPNANPCAEIALSPAGPCLIEFEAIATDIPTEAIEALLKVYTLNEILESIVTVLKSQKNPERYIFELYLFAKRTFFGFAKDKAAGIIDVLTP